MTNQQAAGTQLCQIALSVTDLRRSVDWYHRAFGLQPAGTIRQRVTDGPALVSGLPECSLEVWCVVDRQEWMQFEIMEFEKPRMRRLPADWRPSDLGYSMIGLHVEDFDVTLECLIRTSGRLLTTPSDDPGRRRVCVRDPDGILLELMEDDVRSVPPRPRPHGGVPTTIRSVTLSVASLNRARRFWVDGLGCEETSMNLHCPEHERLWGLNVARRESLTLWAGDVLIELVRYERPAWRARPAGYLISDQGILNVGFGYPSRGEFNTAYARLLRLGFRPNSAPWRVPGRATVVYFTDDQGFSVELLHVEPDGMEYMGFRPGAAPLRGKR
jgi:catechol 2,3-dioxygenase-like lactoylglutathione lyase family enzyme